MRNSGYGIDEGDVLFWKESFCCRMIKGEGRQFAARSDECAAYVNAPIGQKMPIKAYIGMPLLDEKNNVLGTLCGIDPKPDVVGIESGEAVVRQTAALISRLMAMELQTNVQRKLADSLGDLSLYDSLTGLLNYRGWDNRCQATAAGPQTSDVLGVLVLDLVDLRQVNDRDGTLAGDTLIRRAAGLLTQSMRGLDAVARLNGNEYGVLLRCQNTAQLVNCAEQIICAFQTGDIAASVGYAATPPCADLASAFQAANLQMLKNKHAKK